MHTALDSGTGNGYNGLMNTTGNLLETKETFLPMNLTTTTAEKPNPFQLDYSDPRNDPVLIRALWQIKDFGLKDVIETVTRREGVINSTAWSWTLKLRTGQYRSVAAVVEYDPLKGWNYDVRQAIAETPAKRRQKRISEVG